MHCSIHYINYEHGRGCPGCRADQEAEDRQNIQNTLDSILESQRENQIDVSELVDKLNNPGDYYCPACKLKSLKFLAKRCPKCQVDINDIDAGYWDREIAWRKAQAEKEALRQKAEAEKKARLDKEKAKADKKALAEAEACQSKEMSCFLLVVVILGILIACIVGVKSLFEAHKTKNSLTNSDTYSSPTESNYAPPAKSEYTPPLFVAPTPEQTQTEPAPSVPKEPERFFTLGSTMDEVRLAQGKPDGIYKGGGDGNLEGEEWQFGQPSFWAVVYFLGGRVEKWESYRQGQLKSRVIPSSPVNEALQYFTVGSTKDEVLFVQGQPQTIKSHRAYDQTEAERLSGEPTIISSWVYGSSWPYHDYSEVFFRNDKVTHWTTGPVALKARIVPQNPVDPTLGYFTLGSTKDEVLTVQGQPDNPFDFDWKYGRSKIYFSRGSILVVRGSITPNKMVIRWQSDVKNPLKARIVPNGPVDETLQYFTVGSTKDEVLFVQGQPDSINPYADTDTWAYGPSSVNFKKGRVVNWISYPYHAPLKVKPKK